MCMLFRRWRGIGAAEQFAEPEVVIALIGIAQVKRRITVIACQCRTIIIIKGADNRAIHQRNIFLNLRGRKKTGIDDHAIKPFVIGSNPGDLRTVGGSVNDFFNTVF